MYLHTTTRTCRALPVSRPTHIHPNLNTVIPKTVLTRIQTRHLRLPVHLLTNRTFRSLIRRLVTHSDLFCPILWLGHILLLLLLLGLGALGSHRTRPWSKRRVNIRRSGCLNIMNQRRYLRIIHVPNDVKQNIHLLLGRPSLKHTVGQYLIQNYVVILGLCHVLLSMSVFWFVFSLVFALPRKKTYKYFIFVFIFYLAHSVL
jgi:hypothetical protein